MKTLPIKKTTQENRKAIQGQLSHTRQLDASSKLGDANKTLIRTNGNNKKNNSNNNNKNNSNNNPYTE